MAASATRYSAAHLFYLLSLCAAATSLFGVWGLPIAASVVLVWWQILSGAKREAMQGSDRERSELSPAKSPSIRQGAYKIELAVVLVSTAILLGLLLPARSDSDPMRHASTSLALISKALGSYEQRYGCQPPVVVVDRHGVPMHSWRALILPELGEDKLAAEYRLDEPWNSPHNLQLAKYLPWHYRQFYPSADPTGGHTSTHLLTSAVGSWVVEHEQFAESWTRPTQLSWEQLNAVNVEPDLEEGFWRRGFFTSQYRGRLLVSPQQTVQLLPGARIEPELRPSSLAVPADNQRTFHVVGRLRTHYHWQNALRLSFFLVVVLFPIRWLKRIRQAGDSSHSHGNRSMS